MSPRERGEGTVPFDGLDSTDDLSDSGVTAVHVAADLVPRAG